MAIGFPDHNRRMRRFERLAGWPVSALHWPLGRPDGAETLADLTADDHLVLTLRSSSLLARLEGLACRVSARIAEPPIIQRRYYQLLRVVGRHYHRVLTHNSRLLSQLPNARFVPHGGCWLGEWGGSEQAEPKTGLVSLIASNKRGVVGHRLRHRIAEWSQANAPELRLFGRAFEPLDNKTAGHGPFRYSVVIENSREPGYFTEKILDSVLCRSVPIYWGAPDIAHFFDVRGLVVCSTEAELQRAILDVSDADYEARLPYLEANRRRALDYIDWQQNAARLLQAEDEFAVRAA